MRLLVKVFLTVAVLVTVFVAGVFSSNSGIWAILTGNVGTQVEVRAVLERVQPLSQLTTVRYTYSNVFDASRDLPPLLALAYGQKITLNATGYVVAGIDLSQLTEADVTIQTGTGGSTFILTLPAPMLQDCFFNEQDSKVVAWQSAAFANYPRDLQIEARKIAIRHFRDAAVEQNILDEARIQAENAMLGLLELAIGNQYDKIIIQTKPVDMETLTFPITCQ